MKNRKEDKDGLYTGICEFPDCNNIVISPSKYRKYCKECKIRRNKDTNEFYNQIKKKPKHKKRMGDMILPRY